MLGSCCSAASNLFLPDRLSVEVCFKQEGLPFSGDRYEQLIVNTEASSCISCLNLYLFALFRFDLICISALAIGYAIGELNLAIPVFGWSEGPASISVSAERAITFTEFEVGDGKSITINIRAVFQELLFSDADAAVFINSA